MICFVIGGGDFIQRRTPPRIDSHSARELVRYLRNRCSPIHDCGRLARTLVGVFPQTVSADRRIHARRNTAPLRLKCHPPLRSNCRCVFTRDISKCKNNPMTRITATKACAYLHGGSLKYNHRIDTFKLSCRKLAITPCRLRNFSPGCAG